MASRDAADPTIFKAYDIRGLYGEQIDGDARRADRRARSRACSASSTSKPTARPRVGLGHDMRLSAPELSRALPRRA